MKIGLMGFNFNEANKGCEALTYSFINMLNDIINRPFQIVSIYNDESLGMLPEEFTNISFEVSYSKIKSLRNNIITQFRSCDLIFDITCGDGFSDIYFPKLVAKTTLLKELAIISGTPLILLPQTYGSFNNNLLRRFAARVIKRSFKVYSRDKQSMDYVQMIANRRDISNVTDIAFALPYKSLTLPGDKIKLGINVSGLLWRGGFTSDNQFNLTVEYCNYICSVIEHYYCKNDFEIHIIPHVIEKQNNNLDGDIYVCNELKDKYSKLIIAPAFKNPIEAKNYIASMDVFIGARMHSTIAAFSAGVPVIPFSYSRKFEGLYENLEYPYVIHGCQDSTQAALNKTYEWIATKHELKKNVVSSLKIIDEYLMLFKNDLSKLIKSIEGTTKNA